jgi:hypothetical protein
MYLNRGDDVTATAVACGLASCRYLFAGLRAKYCSDVMSHQAPREIRTRFTAVGYAFAAVVFISHIVLLIQKIVFRANFFVAILMAEVFAIIM